MNENLKRGQSGIGAVAAIATSVVSQPKDPINQMSDYQKTQLTSYSQSINTGRYNPTNSSDK